MAKIDEKIIEGRFWWYRLWQYLIAFLLFISIPVIAVYLCQIFKLPQQTYYYAGGLFLLQLIMLYFSPRWILKLIASYPGKYQKVTEENHPKFHARLVKLAEKSKIKMPDVFIIDSETPNAFALKVAGGTYIASITRKLMEILDEDEQEAVMGHEFGHIANDDVRLTMYIAVFNILMRITNKHIIDLIMRRGLESSENQANVSGMRKAGATSVFPVIFTVNIAYQILTYFPYLVVLLFSRVMQQKEYRADAHAAFILGDTEKMKSGLVALHKYSQKIPMFPAALNPLFATPVAYHFFVWPLLLFPTFRDEKDALKKPSWGRRLRNLFESHPLPYDRVKRLENYEVKE